MRTGWSLTYCTETWLLASGRSHLTAPVLRTRVSSRPKLVREHDRRRHQLRRLVRGVAEHQPLVARPLLGRLLAFGRPRIHALRDVGALRRNGVQDQHPVGVKDVVVMRVADVADGLAGDRVEVRAWPWS